jgi:hypothetical protein
MTTEAPSRQAFANMLARHEQERATFAAQLLAEEKAQASQLREAFNPEAGAALAEAFDQIERQVRQNKRADKLLARVEPVVPSWVDANLPALDPDEADAGRRRMVLYIPPPLAGGGRESVVLAVVDVTDALHGPGARARRDQDQLNRERLTREQLARDVDEREREALRR